MFQFRRFEIFPLHNLNPILSFFIPPIILSILILFLITSDLFFLLLGYIYFQRISSINFLFICMFIIYFIIFSHIFFSILFFHFVYYNIYISVYFFPFLNLIEIILLYNSIFLISLYILLSCNLPPFLLIIICPSFKNYYYPFSGNDFWIDIIL